MTKFYTEKQVAISALMGGPLPAGYLIYRNFIKLEKKKEALIAILGTLVFTLVLLITLIELPEEILDKIPNILFSSIYGGIVYGIFRLFLHNDVNEKLMAGAIKMSNWSVAGVTFLGVVVFIGIAAIIGFTQPPFDGFKKEYEYGNAVYFNSEEIPASHLDQISNSMFEFGYFDQEFPGSIFVNRTEINYNLTIPIQEEYWNDQYLYVDLKSVMNSLELSLSTPIVVTLESYSLNGDTKHKRIE